MENEEGRSGRCSVFLHSVPAWGSSPPPGQLLMERPRCDLVPTVSACALPLSLHALCRFPTFTVRSCQAVHLINHPGHVIDLLKWLELPRSFLVPTWLYSSMGSEFYFSCSHHWHPAMELKSKFSSMVDSKESSFCFCQNVPASIK